MVDSDILLDDEGIELRPADGSVAVNAGPDEVPSIRLTPATGTVRVGGGTNDQQADDVWGIFQLDSGDGEPRIFVEAGDSVGDVVPPNQSENAVFVTSAGRNQSGHLALGSVGEDRARVTLDGWACQLTLGGDGDIASGNILAFAEGLIETLLFTGDDAVLRVGGTDTNDNGVPGEIRVRNDARDLNTDRNRRGTVTVAAEAGAATSDDGGSISVADYRGEPTVHLSGASGKVSLGNGAASDGSGIAGCLSLVDTSDGETISLDGATGAISATSLDVSEGLSVEGGLDLGNGVVLDVDDDGVVTLGDPVDGEIGMRLDPSTGSFSITDANGDAVFEVDTQAKEVNTSKSYRRSTIDGTEPGST